MPLRYDAFLKRRDPASGGAGPDVKMAVTRVAANTSTGNQAITGASVDGVPFTPKAAIFIMSTATSDGVAAAHNMRSFGVTDGSNQWAQSYVDQDGSASSAASRRFSTDQAIQCHAAGGTTIDGEASFVSFNSGGVTINWDDAPAAAYLITVIYFGGADSEAHVGVLNDIDTGSQSVAGMAHQPQLVIGCWSILLSTQRDTGTAIAFTSLGWSDGTFNGSHMFRSENGQASANLRSELSSVDLIESNGSPDACTITMNSDGFTATEVDSITADREFGYLSLYLGGLSVWAGIVDSPTATGNAGVTAPGFTPQLVMQIPTSHTAVNSEVFDGTGCGYAISAFTDDAEYCTAWASEDAAADMNTQSLSEDRALVLTDHTGAALAEADFVSMDGSGWTLNYTTAPGTACKFLALAVAA